MRAHDLGLAVALSSLTAACGASSGRASAGGGGGGASPSSAHTTTDATAGTRAATSHGHGGGSAGGAGGGVGGAGQGGDATTAPSATGVGGAAGLGGAAGVGGAAQATTAPAATTSASTGAGNPFGGCLPTQQATTNGGGTCSDLDEAYTARGINVGYYPFKVLTPVPQYSGDFSGTQGTIFTSSGPWKGVVLQMIPAGSYVGLSSSGPWYNPASDCLASNSCGDPSVDACTDDSPPLRPSVGGFAWGYAYDGASHMQGWIPLDGAALEFAGFDAGHPCALGPAGVDFEVHSACNMTTSCAGDQNTCGAANKCDEGADDCGRTQCGAMSGGPLTPSAWHRTVGSPSGAHACTTTTPPNPSVACLANGSDPDFFFVYPFGAYLYWGQNSTTKAWLHYGDGVQAYFHTRDAQGVLWDFVEVLASGAPALTPASDGAGAVSPCSSTSPQDCTPCKNGGTCGWVQDVFLQ